ncbi:polysaccharide deacetylase family protein [Arthrobacter sp. 2MCAF14]|uniref:polysaccharide deacetylase family protein n=1 Tax=Arthrobacter sp. 2MCAF14 TaxID=3232982 RepID=UPI003F91C6AB
MTRTRSSLARGRTGLATIAVAAGAMVAALLSPTAAYAAVINPAATPLVSFTFDDGQQSALTQAAPTLQKYGLTGTSYIITNCVGMTTVPNTCRANTDVPYLTWPQVTQLQNTYGWEIGSHTVDHQCLVSVGGDCQNNKLTAAQVDAELANSKAALAANGFNATAFAPPYGDYDMSALAQIAKYYTSMRGFADTGNNIWPLGDLLLRDTPAQEVTTPVATLKAKVDEAIANKTWAVFTFHDIRPAPSQVPDDYEYGTAELDQLAAYVQTKVAAGQIKNVNISNGLVTGSPNKLANPTFNNGIGDGWRTDAPTTITADAANNGSFPDSAKSVKLVSGATTGHLFSPTVPVSPATNYMFKAFLNVAAITSGEVGFYVDEYNSAGQWISGQYRKRENSHWVESMNFTYMPSSSSVASASLQIWVVGTGITAYVDNVQMLALGAETLPPPPSNLVANGTFDAGISSGWTTDSAATIVADAANHGSPANPVNSVKLTATTANKHLFSPQIAVTAGTYAIASYLNVTARTSGEVGFYIDEYNAAGQWISGQYKLGVTAAGVSNVNLTYSPSTTAVAKASLQVIVQGNSGIQAYFDDVRWWRP